MKWIVVVAILTMWSSADAGQWKNSLKPIGDPGQEITLASEGATSYQILIPSNPTAMDVKAAEDLARWLNEMTGAEIPVAREGGAPEKFISVGQTQLAADAGISPGSPDLGRDGYCIAQRGENLFLLGGSRHGPINAVYALLEEDLGCRWYDAHTPMIPKIERLTFQPVPRSFKPALDIRDPYYFEAFNGEWSLRNRTNGNRSNIPVEYGGFSWAPQGWLGHGFSRILPQGEQFKEHPEYYALIDGERSIRQLCLANKDVLKLTIAKALETLRKDPGASLISISDYDGGGHCQCPECKALDDANGGRPSGSMITFVNKVAEAIEAEFPRVTVTAAAYLDRIDPPTKVRPRKNVAIQLCNDLHAWRWPLVDFASSPRPLSKQYRDAVEGWSKICEQILIWDYTANFEHYIGPMPNMHVIAPSVNFYLRNHVSGILLQGSYQGPGGERAAMRAWVMAKFLWNPEWNINELQRDFVYGYYGESAEPIWQYYQLLETSGRAVQDKVGEVGGIRFAMTAPFITPEFISRADELFAKALSLAKTDQIRNRVLLEKLPIIYVKLVRHRELAGGQMNALIDEFEQITSQSGVEFIKEGSPDVKRKIAYWRSMALLNPSQYKAHRIGDVWKVRLDPSEVGEAEKWFAPELDDSSWHEVRSDIDQGWDAQGLPVHIGYGWYRQRVHVTEEMLNSNHLWLLFAAVDEDADVYIDGTKVFSHTCQATGLRPSELYITPFKVDAKPHLTAGEHVIAVRVYNCFGAGGIWKPVYFVTASVDPVASALLDAIQEDEAQEKTIQPGAGGNGHSSR